MSILEYRHTIFSVKCNLIELFPVKYVNTIQSIVDPLPIEC